MTSRYRAAQRAVELVARLQDEGLTVDEIAAEMRRLNVSVRQGGNDPAADLCASVQDMVADFAKALGQPPAEESALRARAEAAEQRAEAAEIALKQAQADLRVMAALGGNIVHKRYMHSPSILSDAVLSEWERAEAASAEVADGDLFAVLRRALGVAS